MKKIVVVVAVAFSLSLIACGQKEAGVEKNEPTQKKESAKKKKDEVTVEKYVSFYKERDALLMEKYWPKFKGKSYEDVKDLYAKYLEEEKALSEKHGIADLGDLYRFFRKNFRQVREYRENDPEYKKYPEMQDAKATLVKFASARATE